MSNMPVHVKALAVLPCIALMAFSVRAESPMENFLGRSQRYQAEFVETTLDRNGRTIWHAAGTLHLVRPDTFRCDYRKSNSNWILGDARMVWHYHAGFDRITVLKGDKAKGACAAALAAGIDIESFFNLHEAGAGSGRPWMLGMAKDGHPSLFESVRIDFRDGNLQAAEFRDIFGQVLQIRFSSQNYDPVMDRNLFIFIPPVRAE